MNTDREKSEHLLIVDDDRLVGQALRRILQEKGRVVHLAENGVEALEVSDRHPIGVIVSDRMMPGIDGVTLLETLRYRRPETVRILITGYSTETIAIEAVNRSWVFGYVTKPWSNEEMRELVDRAFQHHKRLRDQKDALAGLMIDPQELRLAQHNMQTLQRNILDQLHSAEREAVYMLTLAAEAKDDDTGLHIQRVGKWSSRIGEMLRLDPPATEEIGFYGMIHDVGKIHVPDHILKKAGPLDDQERAVMKSHTVHGERILGTRACYRVAREITRSHHERWDGSGYPDGLKGQAIPLAARIVAVADVYDALTHKRAYKPAWPEQLAVAEIAGQSAKAFDPQVVKAFLALHEASVVSPEKAAPHRAPALLLANETAG